MCVKWEAAQAANGVLREVGEFAISVRMYGSRRLVQGLPFVEKCRVASGFGAGAGAQSTQMFSHELPRSG